VLIEAEQVIERVGLVGLSPFSCPDTRLVIDLDETVMSDSPLIFPRTQAAR
jgi:hypothetical protein